MGWGIWLVKRPAIFIFIYYFVFFLYNRVILIEMNEIFYTQNTNLPRLEVIVSGNGAAVDLTDATGVIFSHKPRYSGTAGVISGRFASKGSGIVYVDLTGTTVTDSLGPRWGKFLIYFQNGGVRPYPEGYINFEILSGV